MSQVQLADGAEDLAAAWASQAGLTVTRACRDRWGWDHLLEFSAPRPSTDSGPLGIPTVEFSARLQVKATSSSKRKVRINVKLSNWKRAIEDLLPWFFLIMRIDKATGEPSEVALVHVGRELVEAALRRIYRLPRSDRGALHKHYMNLSWLDSDVLDKPYPSSLRACICEAVGPDPFSYAKEKHSWYESAGIADASAHATFQVQGATEEELYRRLSRAAVGLDDTLEISNLTVTRTRFDVEEPDHRFPPEKRAFLRISPTPQEQSSTLIISRRDGSQAVELKGLIRFSAAVFPMLPKDFWILRFETLLLDLVVDIEMGHLNLRWVPPAGDHQFPIQQLAPPFTFLRLLDESPGRPLLFQLRKGEGCTALGTQRLTVTLSPDLLRLTRRACAVSALVRELGTDLSASLSLRDIRTRGQLAELLLAARHQTELAILVEATIPEGGFDPSKPAAVITNPTFTVGSLVYAEVVTFTGSIHVLSSASNEVRVRVHSTRPRSLESFQLSAGQVHTFIWDEAFARATAALEAEGFDNILTAPWHTMADLGS